MIHYIKGIITDTAPGLIYIENSSGIGFQVNVPDGAFKVLPGSADAATVYTSMVVREDDISLYGFSDRENLRMFEMLTSVSGIGPKAALAIISVLPARELKKAIVFEDVAAITRANGVGKKGAQRVVMELKDKVGLPDDVPSGITSERIENAGGAKTEAVAALMSLGFTRSEAMQQVMSIEGEELSTEEYIKRALRQKR